MASLGTLTLDLIAKIGGFTGPMDKASQNTKKNMNDIKVSTIAAGNVIADFVGNIIGSIPGALNTLATGTARTAAEVSKLAQVAGLSTTEFQKLAAGAASVGIDQAKLSDIYKDVNDKVTDFLDNAGGPLVDFFTNIAPKVGVTADQFKKLNSAEALQLYVSTLQKANASQEQMTFYMEAIANDATGLIPLLRDNGKQFKELGDAAAAAGAIMSVSTIAVSKEFSAELVTLEQNITGAKNQLADEFMPALAQFTKDINAAAKAAGGLDKVVGELVQNVITVSAFIANAGDGIVRVFDIGANTLVGLYATAAGRMQQLAAGGSKFLAMLPGETGKKFAKQSATYRAEFETNMSVAAQAASAIRNNLETPLVGDQFKKYIADAKAAAAESAKLLADKPVSAASKRTDVDPAAIKAASDAAKKAASDAAAARKKEASDAAAAAKKIQDSFENSEEGYEREIALINITSDKRKDATEIAKLQFEIEKGNLVGINEQQQTRLNSLAKELDARKALKTAAEDQAKVDAFAAAQRAGLDATAGGFDMELAGAGSSDKMKDRLKANLQIQQDYAQAVKDLQEQQNSGDLSKELYEQETAILADNLNKRMELQEDYYKRQDEAQADWLDGVSEAWENYAETARDYSEQANEFTTDQFDTLTNSVAGAFEAIITENQSLGESFRNIIDAMVSSVVSGLAQMAAQWLVYQLVQLVAGKTTQASATAAMVANAQATSLQAGIAAFASTAAIPIVGPFAAPGAMALALATTAPLVAGVAAAGLAGMAHDGIDSVPQTGTWLLQKGERVTTAQTSAKLDETLSRMGSGGSATVNQTIQVQGNVDRRTRAQIANDAARNQRQAQARLG